MNGKVIGYAGMAYPEFLNAVIEGSAFILEVDADMLLETPTLVPVFKPLHKYQGSWRDISMLIPLDLTVSELEQQIKAVSPLITSVELVDFFQKKEWHDVRSVTMRFSVVSSEKTITSEEIDAVYDLVIQRLKNNGATIR